MLASTRLAEQRQRRGLHSLSAAVRARKQQALATEHLAHGIQLRQLRRVVRSWAFAAAQLQGGRDTCTRLARVHACACKAMAFAAWKQRCKQHAAQLCQADKLREHVRATRLRSCFLLWRLWSDHTSASRSRAAAMLEHAP
jgi:hypothetical protein